MTTVLLPSDPERADEIVKAMTDDNHLAMRVRNLVKNRYGMEITESDTQDTSPAVPMAGSSGSRSNSGPQNNTNNDQTDTHNCAYALCESEEPAKYRCAACKKVWYCNRNCQRDDDDHHVFSCKNRNIDSSHLFHRNIIADETPTNRDVLRDFGFNRCKTASDITNLFGVYIGLVKIGNKNSRALRSWQTSCRLWTAIREHYEAIPAPQRGGYYPWLQQHSYISDPQAPTLSIDKNIIKLYSLLLRGLPDSKDRNIWLFFGFATCPTNYWKIKLREFYMSLFRGVPLHIFQQHYRTKQLFRMGCIAGLQTQARHLNQGGVTIGTSPESDLHSYPSAYDLIEYLQFSLPQAKCPRPVIVDYGYCMCETDQQEQLWKATYKTIFERPGFRAIKLAEACVAGNIFEYAKDIWPEVPAAFESLSRNMYPLPPEEDAELSSRMMSFAVSDDD